MKKKLNELICFYSGRESFEKIKPYLKEYLKELKQELKEYENAKKYDNKYYSEKCKEMNIKILAIKKFIGWS